MAAASYKEIDGLNFPFTDYVLALPGWYPTWLDPLPGDFNQRHIKAASLFKPLVVLYVGKDPSGTLYKTEVRTNQLTDRVVEVTVIYPQSKIKWWDAIQSNINFLILLYKFSEIIKTKYGKPQLLHAYIVMRGGLAGWLLSRRWNLPFILTENWTIYYPEDPGYLPKRNFIFRWLVKNIFRYVTTFLPVTTNLQKRAAGLVGEVPFSVIPNVVETGIFKLPEPVEQNPFKFIHVSTMIYQKNPEGLLRCFKKFNKDNSSTFLQMVGPYPPEVFEYAKTLGLTDKQIEFTGAVSYLKVAELLKRSNALVLFSRYENLPCVILEAFCCGLPVIATRVGGIDEVINEENGLLLDNENELQLLEAFNQLYSKYASYKKDDISNSAIENYSYAAVGRKINEVYEKILVEH
jgi:glycosyltransferase involved in cell wall biosynthesis